MRDLDAVHWRRSVEGYSGVGIAKTVQTVEGRWCLLKCVHDLSDFELALLIVDQVKGTAKDELDFEINDIMGLVRQ